MNNESQTGVILPEDNIIDTKWAKEQLERVDMFSTELLNYGKGEVFYMLRSNLSTSGYEQSIAELNYTVETAETYISYLQKRPVLEAVKEKYYVALSLSATEYLPDSIEDGLALLDICVAKYGKPTADNLRRAAEDNGTAVKKMSASAITVEALKKKALHEWLLEEHQLSDDDIYQASRLSSEGKSEFLEKMLQAYSLLEDWQAFYKEVAPVIMESTNTRNQRFLSDLNDASGSIIEYLQKEKAFNELNEYKEVFANEIYPKLSFDAETK